MVRQHVHFLLALGVSAGRLWQMRCSTAERYKKKRCDTVLYRRDLTARMIVEYKAPEIEITQKVFDQITRYNMVPESGLSDCQQRASTLLLPHRLRAQQLYFSARYTRVSKLIGGATNSPPCLSHLIASYTMRDMRAMMFALSSSVSYESMTKAAMKYFPARPGRITRPASLSAVFIPSALRSEEPVLCPTTVLAGNIPFSLLAPVSSIYSWSAQKSFSSLLENNSFSSAVLSSRTIAEGYSQLRYTASKLGACRLLFPRGWRSRYSIGGYSHWYVWCLLHILSRCRRHCCRFRKCCLHQFPKRNREILVETSSAGAVGIGRHLGYAFMEAMLSRLSWFAYPSCPVRPVPHGIWIHWAKGKCTWSLYRSMSPLSVHTAIPTVAFFAHWADCQSGFQVQTFAAPGRQ